VGKSLVNEFTWSISRHQKFAECRRAYWFHYYRSWGGWEPDAPAWKRELYVLKQLGNRFTWAGSIAHAAIRGTLNAIRARRPVDPERVLQRVHRVMRQDFVSSREKRQWRDTIRRDFNGLVEHEYADAVTSEAWHRAWLTVRGALQWFFDSRWPGLAQSLRSEDWLEVDNQQLGEASHRFRGVKVFSVPDFAYRNQSDGSVQVIEWKTGESARSHETQLVGSALFIESRHGAALPAMRASVVFLSTGVEQPMPLSTAAVARFHGLFSSSVGSMRSVLRNPSKNVPLDEDAFPRALNPAVCARCPFRRPCREA